MEHEIRNRKAKWPIYTDAEENALIKVLMSGRWWHETFGSAWNEEGHVGDSQVSLFQKEFAEFHSCKYGIATANGTGALEVAIRCLGLSVGDEIILPAYTYMGCATSIVQNNLVPIFVDIEPDTYNIDPEKILEAITDKTKAILVVHFGGRVANMTRILEIAHQYNLKIIEDAAHAHGCEWNGKKAGSFGDMAVFSFQASKNMTSGEGGIITTNNREFAEMADSLIWCGRNYNGAWYEAHRIGWNYRLGEFQAAILREQLKRLSSQNKHRATMAIRLSERIQDLTGMTAIISDQSYVNGYHLLIFKYDETLTGIMRGKFIQEMNQAGVPVFVGYEKPVYRLGVFEKKCFINGSFPLGTQYHEDIDYPSFSEKCPNTERACEKEAIWLTHSALLSVEEYIDFIADTIGSIVNP